MEEPHIAEKRPAIMTLDPGTYYWCHCGKSKNQPFCDGTHQGSSFTPVAIELEEKKQVALCQCKHTKTPPYCDGTHNTLKEKE